MGLARRDGGHRPCGLAGCGPWRALASAVPGPAGPQGTVPQGRGKRAAFPDPARRGGGTAPLPWQGPSPLPQRYVDTPPAGGQSPRPAPDPPTAGASRPPGRALAFRGAWTDRSTGHRAARAGETPCVSWSRPERSFPGCPVSLAGAIAPATAPRCPLTSRGPQPPASARPAPGGRWPALRLGGRSSCDRGLSPGGETRCVS